MVAANFSDRKFGVEIECIGMSIDEVKTLFKANGIPVTDNTEKYDKWSVKEDASIKGAWINQPTKCYSCDGTGKRRWDGGCNCSTCNPTGVKRGTLTPCGNCNGTGSFNNRVSRGAEVVSPILSGAEGLKHLQKVVTLMKDNGISANESCGLHVHVFAKDHKKIDVLNVFHRYSKFEKNIDKWIKPDRRENKNSYCLSTTSSNVSDEISLDDIFSEIDGSRSLEEQITTLYNVVVQKKMTTATERKVGNAVVNSYFNIDRHCKINLSAYLDLGTVEFRHHHGSVDPVRIKNWVMFCVQFFEQSVKKEQPEKDGLYLGVNRGIREYFTGESDKTPVVKKKKITKKRAA